MHKQIVKTILEKKSNKKYLKSCYKASVFKQCDITPRIERRNNGREQKVQKFKSICGYLIYSKGGISNYWGKKDGLLSR